MLICRLKTGKILAAVKDVAAISPYLSLLISSTQIRCAWRMSLLSHHDGGRQPLASVSALTTPSTMLVGELDGATCIVLPMSARSYKRTGSYAFVYWSAALLPLSLGTFCSRRLRACWRRHYGCRLATPPPLSSGAVNVWRWVEKMGY
jgi:hypothetical protein